MGVSRAGVPMGVCLGGCVHGGGQGVQWGYLPGEGGVHLPVYRITDRCKNITFLQLRLRTVKIEGVIVSYLRRKRIN